MQIKGIEETVCVAGMERLQRMLRMQWAEANLLSTAVRRSFRVAFWVNLFGFMV